MTFSKDPGPWLELGGFWSSAVKAGGVFWTRARLLAGVEGRSKGLRAEERSPCLGKRSLGSGWVIKMRLNHI